MASIANPSRRQLIAGAGAGALALAGCGTGESPSADPAPGGDTEAGQEPAEGTTLTPLADIKVGEAVLVKADTGEVLVCRSSESEAVAFSAICTHKGCTVEPSGPELVCPCHNSRFSVTDGAVLGGPADEPLAKVDVHVKSGNVVAGSA